MQIRKYGIYAFVKDLEKNVAFIVFEETNDTVEGVVLKIGKTEKKSYKKENFKAFLSYKLLEFIEVLPKKVWKEYYKIFKNNQ